MLCAAPCSGVGVVHSRGWYTSGVHCDARVPLPSSRRRRRRRRVQGLGFVSREVTSITRVEQARPQKLGSWTECWEGGSWGQEVTRGKERRSATALCTVITLSSLAAACQLQPPTPGKQTQTKRHDF